MKLIRGLAALMEKTSYTPAMSSEPDKPKRTLPPPSIKKKPAAPPPQSFQMDSPPSSAPAAVEEKKPAVAPLQVNATPDREEGDKLPVEAVDESLVSFGTRVTAALIDLGIAFGLYLSVVIFAKMTLGFLDFLAFPVFAAAILFRDGLPFLKGQSPGKTAMKIKAVTTSGDSLAGNWSPALIRNAVLLIPLFSIVELVVLLKREDKQDHGIRLGDTWAGTKVIKVDDGETETDAESETGIDEDV